MREGRHGAAPQLEYVDMKMRVSRKQAPVAVAAAAPGTGVAVGRPRRRMTLQLQRTMEGYLFVGPWVLGFLVFLAWPLFQSFYLSFHELQATSLSDLKVRGIDNYKEAFFIDARFLPNLKTTLTNNALDIPVIMIFSLFSAILANQKIKGIIGFRAVFFLPLVIGSAQVIQQLFAQGVGGAVLSRGVTVQQLVEQFMGPDAAAGVTDLLNRLLFVLWKTGVQMLIFLAGLNSVSPVLYEAARVDGATDWDRFWKVTLPLLSPVILVNLVYTIVDSFTDPFNQVLTYVQQTAFAGGFRLGYAAALGWIYFVIVFLILAIVVKITNRYVFYAGERNS
jgi:ABC-type sugar transport system permease subunit